MNRFVALAVAFGFSALAIGCAAGVEDTYIPDPVPEQKEAPKEVFSAEIGEPSYVTTVDSVMNAPEIAQPQPAPGPGF